MPRTKRVQVLMDHAEFTRLEGLAAAAQVSVGELIRQAIQARYFHQDEQRLTAAQTLNNLGLPRLAPDQLEGALIISRSEGLR